MVPGINDARHLGESALPRGQRLSRDRWSMFPGINDARHLGESALPRG